MKARIATLLLLLALLCAPAFAAQGPFFHASMEGASRAAQADDSLVLVVFRASWCVFCKAFNEKTLENKDFTKSGAPVHVLALDTDLNADLARQYRVGRIPDLILMTPDGKIVARKQGLMDPAELLAWIGEGKSLADKGRWMGVARNSSMEAFLAEFEQGRPGREDYRKLIGMLASDKPGDRLMATELLYKLREKAMPHLIEAAGDPYLGQRVGAAEVIRTLAPDAPPYDPWEPREQRAQDLARLDSWWKKNPVLPDPEKAAAAPLRSVAEAVASVAGKDLMARNRAMNYLVFLGPETLPAIRKAITRALDHQDRAAAWALEDVRWTILLPGDLARKNPGLVRDLARGDSGRRQEAAAELSRFGEEALPALAELAAIPDPLLQDAALTAMHKTGSARAIDFMARMTESENANLRMTAVSLLGKLSDHDEGVREQASLSLTRSLKDPVEAVVLTGLAALRELNAKNQAPAIMGCLEDPRWRVRAEAAQALKELGAIDAGPALRKLLDDPDPFVVKNALEACFELKTPPSAEELVALVPRYPNLSSMVGHQLVMAEPEADVETFSAVFEGAGLPQKKALLKALEEGKGRISPRQAGAWEPFIQKALGSPEPELRRQALASIPRPQVTAASFIGPAFSDPDPGVRSQAAFLAALLALHHYGFGDDDGEAYPDFGALKPEKAGEKQARSPSLEGPRASEERKKELAELHAAWRQALAGQEEARTDLPTALAFYFTGPADRNFENLEALVTAQALEALGDDRDRSNSKNVLNFLLSRLPWPQSRPLAASMRAQPPLAPFLLESCKAASPELAAFLLDPKVLAGHLGSGPPKLRGILAEQLMEGELALPRGMEGPEQWYENLGRELSSSENPFLQALAVALCAQRPDCDMGSLEGLARDPDPWVRRMLALAVANKVRRQEDKEKLLAPLVRDPSAAVRSAALFALLTPRARSVSDLSDKIATLQYAGLSVRFPRRYDTGTDRPLAAFRRQPAFIRDLARSYPTRDMLLNEIIVLACAQYGQSGPLKQYLKAWEKEDGLLAPALLAAIQFSGDPSLIPYLRLHASRLDQSYELSGALAGARLMKGPEARSFRRWVNQKVQEPSYDY